MLTTITPHQAHAPEQRLAQTAQRFEGAFLAQMLKASGAGRPPDGVGGGIGEAQFASFLTDLRAQAMARQGGLGLAETIIRSLDAGDARP